MSDLIRALCGALLLAGPALAEIRPVDVNYPVRTTGFGYGYGENTTQFWGEVGFFTGTDDQDTTRLSISPMMRIFAPVLRNEVELSWGFIYHDIDLDVGEDQSTTRIGNPFLAHYWTWRSLERQMRFGVGATAPAAFLRDRLVEQGADRDAYFRAAAMRGFHDLWLWTPEHVSGVLHGDYLHRTPDGWVFGGELKFGGMFGIGDSRTEEDDFEPVVDVMLIGQHESTIARVFLHVGYVRLLDGDSDDSDMDDLISAEIGARWRLGPVDMITRAVLPLDNPAGFGADEKIGTTWGFHLGFANPTRLRLPEK